MIVPRTPDAATADETSFLGDQFASIDEWVTIFPSEGRFARCVPSGVVVMMHAIEAPLNEQSGPIWALEGRPVQK